MLGVRVRTACSTLFASKEEVAAAKLLLEHFRVGSLSETVTDEQLWEARKRACRAIERTAAHTG